MGGFDAARNCRRGGACGAGSGTDCGLCLCWRQNCGEYDRSEGNGFHEILESGGDSELSNRIYGATCSGECKGQEGLEASGTLVTSSCCLMSRRKVGHPRVPRLCQRSEGSHAGSLASLGISAARSRPQDTSTSLRLKGGSAQHDAVDMAATSPAAICHRRACRSRRGFCRRPRHRKSDDRRPCDWASSSAHNCLFSP
jgi:hypothetical protein